MTTPFARMAARYRSYVTLEPSMSDVELKEVEELEYDLENIVLPKEDIADVIQSQMIDGHVTDIEKLIQLLLEKQLIKQDDISCVRDLIVKYNNKYYISF